MDAGNPPAKRKAGAKKPGGTAKKTATGGRGANSPSKGAGADKPEAAVKLVDFTGQFLRDLQPMLYGFGDAPAPLPETLAMVEGLLLDYVGTMVQRAADLAGPGAKVTEHELLHLVRKDTRKYSRARELIQMSAVLSETRRLLDDKEGLQAAAAEAEGGEGGAAGDADGDAD